MVVFSDQADWHQDRLVDALRARGVGPVVAPLSEACFEIGGRAPIAIPGCGGRLPRAAMVRGIAAGSFEAVTMRVGVLQGLEDLGVTVWNGARAIARCVDKAACSLALARAGLPTPRTLVTESRTRALDFLAREIGRGNKVVLKPLFGSQGKGLRLLHLARDLPDRDDVYGVYYLQRFLSPAGRVYQDIRVFVSAGRVVAGMVRRGSSWITNVHQGAIPAPIAVTPAMERLALAAVAAVGADFAGVDLMEDGKGGLVVIEVNSMPAWRGLQSTTAIDMADRLAADWLAAARIDAAVVGSQR